jgi:dihydrofolate reductase
MRKIIVSEFVSLDGVIEAPQNWHFPFVTDDMMQIVMSQLMGADAYLYGRKTYEEFASYWPNATDDGSGMADKLNRTPKYVVSTTLQSVDWQPATLIKGNVAEEIRKLKQGPGGDIGLTGSATLIQSLLKGGLIDELQLMVHPVVVGSGKRLFKDGMDKADLKLVETKVFDGGVVLLVYRPDSR